MEKKTTGILVVLAVIVFGLIFTIINLTKNVGKTTTTLDMEKSQKRLEELYRDIMVKNLPIQRGAIDTESEQIAILPDISEYPFTVNPVTDSFITIYASSDMATGEDSWLSQMAKEFNQSNPRVGETPVSVGIRTIPSNLAADFITTEKYTPDIYMPASEIYGMMLDAKEKKYQTIDESVLKNVTGIVITKKVKDSIQAKYKNTDAETIANAVLNGECVIGYTNPLSDEDGLNYFLSILNAFDNQYPLSDTAVSKLRLYQDKTPYVSYHPEQLQDSIRNGTIDGFASNYQYYYTTPSLRNNYEFIPLGIRQDHPVYALGELTNLKSEIIKQFVTYLKSPASQTKASNSGFNANDEYAYRGFQYDGLTVLDAQSLWKKEKNGSSDLTAVFVADISGSMEGSPLLKLKASLNRAASFIDENTNVGLVTFADTVNIALPIAKFDTIQRSYFSNAVKSMRASGGTAMFDAIIVAERMLLQKQQENPNTRLMMFVLTDGVNNRGHEFEDIEDVTRGLRIPVYTIG